MKRLTIGVKACTEIMGLLVAMAWADGSLDEDEKVGIRAAADTLNLEQALRDRLEAFMTKAPTLATLEVDELRPRDREFAYVASAWMARVAKGVDAAERDLLDKIGLVLDIDATRRAELAELAFTLGSPDAGESWSASLVQLFRSIATKVAAEEVDVAFE